MSILSFIENELGSVHNWPQDKLRFIFYIRPTNYTTIEIASFFFGNKIPRDTKLELFQEYNHPSSGQVEILCEKYETWLLRTGFKHMSYYYNMSMGRMVYVNGSDHHQMERVDDNTIGFLIGFGDSFPTCIKRELKITVTVVENKHTQF